MLASGFTNAPVSRNLIIGIVVTSFLATLTDTKYYFWIQVRPHLVDYLQFWRLLTWQLCYTNSTEVLFAAMTLYQLRIVERMWGSRKFASYLFSTFPYTTLIPPLVVALLVRPLTAGMVDFLPAGPTAVIFALLAQFQAAVPSSYKYRITPFGASTSPRQEYGLNLTSKSFSYLLPAQLALSQLPGSAIAAGVGWIVGVAYRREILPGATRWRVPAWAVGGSEQKERYDSLRRRMEGEAGRATGMESTDPTQQHQGETTRRRGFVGGIVDQFRGGS
ncbi:hypothetical protein K431DRAFT_195297, partial [Polychaeton citri CBS 116435]